MNKTPKVFSLKIRFAWYFVFAIQCLFMLSCGPHVSPWDNTCSNHQIPPKFATMEANWPIVDSFRIALPLISDTQYKQYDVCIFESQTLLVWLNEVQNRLLIINATKHSFKAFNLKDFGITKPEEGYVNGLDFVNYDSIFLASSTHIWILDTIHIIDTFLINQSYESSKYGNKLYNLDHSPIRWDPITSSLYFQSYPTKIAIADRRFYEQPVNAHYSLIDKKVDWDIMFYPPVYKDYFFGFETMVFRTLLPGQSLFSFPADNHIYSYDHLTKKVQCYKSKSGLDSVQIVPLERKEHDDIELKMNHMVQSPFYLNILYDVNDHNYYRFFMPALNVKSENGKYTSWQDKELILMKLDSTFNPISEMKLGHNYYLFYKSFVGQEGVYLSRPYKGLAGNPNNEIVFDIIKPNR